MEGIIACLVTIGALLGGCIWLNSADCSNRAEIVQREYRFSALSGCFLKADNGKFLPADAYRDLVD